MSDVFQFMELRAPFSPEAKAMRQSYIRDDVVVNADGDQPARVDVDLSANSPSNIGRLVYEQVFCGENAGDPEAGIATLLNSLLGLLQPYQPQCPAPAYFADNAQPLSIAELERRSYILEEDLYYLLPERLEQVNGLSLFPELQRAFEVMERAVRDFNRPKLVAALTSVFGGTPLAEVVFANGAYSHDFRTAKRTLFDTLYLLYILRRRASVNLEYVIEGLRVLHVLEALAVDSVIEAMKRGSLSGSGKALVPTLERLYPELQGWNGSDPLESLPLIVTAADFEAYFTATPVVHPIFARLHWYTRPFNDIKPIGVGDLKVVKQWLTAYLPGEISHIENVLKGEIINRTLRRLEKSEDTFSLASSSKGSSQTDTQTTDRFELKKEVENVVKSDTNIGVTTNANVTYTYPGGMVVVTANVGASFAYKRETSDTSKTAATFSRETVSKAAQQVEKNVSEQRSATRLFETEDTNVHGFDNKEGKAHVTGIYRWLDKRYKAQLFNYGKRMMFEFVIPEPAAFFVESRLRAFEAALECPQPPQPPDLKTVKLLASTHVPLTPSLINENEFQKLQEQYDLSDFAFPTRSKKVGFFNPGTGDNYFEKVGTNADNDNWSAETYHCKVPAAGYDLKRLFVEGHVGFSENTGDSGTGAAQNTLVILIDGNEVARHTHIPGQYVNYTDGDNFELRATVPGAASPGTASTHQPLALHGDEVALTIGLWDRYYFRLTVNGELTLSAAALLEWQTKVYNRVHTVEQQKVDKENQEIVLTYNTEVSTYKNRLDQLKAKTVYDLLQGQSEAFNRRIIGAELKKHCLTMLTKEFDADASTDVLSHLDPLVRQASPDNFTYRRFEVKEDLKTYSTTGSFVDKVETVKYPFIDLNAAKRKGRFIQFLEQAFEWQQLAYVFYPYFWATQPKWIDMMNRVDETDPNMSAFLQAGSVRVLLAVTPAYDKAVLHFLATREPWEGGPVPVIGDPLFIPLYEELRKQQDDLYNAVPEGAPWTFTLPTSLVYLEGGGATLPTFPDLPTP